MARAMAASQANDSEQAIACFQQASAEVPTAALPQFLLGAEFAARGDVAQAETAYANATRLAPAFPMVRYQLGLLQFSSERAAIALLTWQPLLELPDTDPLPHFVAGFASLAQDHFGEAIQHFERGIPLNKDNAALNGDIEKVVARVRALNPSPASGEPTSQAASDAGAHVLLANYQQQGPAH